MTKPKFSYYTTVELARAATAPKLSTATRIAMLDEINRRDALEAEIAAEHSGPANHFRLNLAGRKAVAEARRS